jgi:peptidoglycan/xylan/chitin deacetylase (PgdA/CDA1 family)
LRRWHAEGWHTLALSNAVRLLQTGAGFPEKSFVLTFDDGYASVYRDGFGLLQELGLTATVFVAPNPRGETHSTTPLPPLYGREMLRWSEIRDMHAHGITFGAHTMTHADLTRCDDAQLDSELGTSQAVLADALGAPISLFAYPFGKYDARVRGRAAQFFEKAVTDRLGLVGIDSDHYALERVETFYLRAPWAADGLTRPWFPFYLAARSVPRSLKRLLSL